MNGIIQSTENGEKGMNNGLRFKMTLYIVLFLLLVAVIVYIVGGKESTAADPYDGSVQTVPDSSVTGFAGSEETGMTETAGAVPAAVIGEPDASGGAAAAGNTPQETKTKKGLGILERIKSAFELGKNNRKTGSAASASETAAGSAGMQVDFSQNAEPYASAAQGASMPTPVPYVPSWSSGQNASAGGAGTAGSPAGNAAVPQPVPGTDAQTDAAYSNAASGSGSSGNGGAAVYIDAASGQLIVEGNSSGQSVPNSSEGTASPVPNTLQPTPAPTPVPTPTPAPTPTPQPVGMAAGNGRVRSASGSLLNTEAEWTASVKDEETVTVQVRLYLEHYQLDYSAYKAVKITLGSETRELNGVDIHYSESGMQRTEVASAEFTVPLKRGESRSLDLRTEWRFGGEYGDGNGNRVSIDKISCTGSVSINR